MFKINNLPGITPMAQLTKSMLLNASGLAEHIYLTNINGIYRISMIL